MSQKELFLELWRIRRQSRVCDLCGKPLGNEPRTFHFSHIISKGSEPKGKLDADNIMFNCLPCHQKWDQGDPTSLKNYAVIVEKKEKLKRKYNNGHETEI